MSRAAVGGGGTNLHSEVSTGRLMAGVLATDVAERQRVIAALAAADITVVAQAATLDEVILSLDSRGPDTFVLAGSPDDEAVKRLRELRKRFPASSIVCVSRRLGWRAARSLLGGGADGIVVEEHIERSLALALRSVHAGQLVLPNELRSHVAAPTLSVREKQILGMVVMGFSNHEIATKLYVAESTVKSHLTSAFAKLGVRSRNEATALILDPTHGLGTGILEISGEAVTPRPRENGTAEGAPPQTLATA